ncbi:glycosyltransferase [Fibrisoma montanum]|uniref:Glycosyltransferase n=1 Tax=Fibrisoma montanum TaxID=2305895 RepID=A0A418M8F7_9BACT|nr:glycosyltransferase [Fibrisoma montanum]RIV22377.1 glycosyltransferase [Fibrisoma montanum]
MQHTSLERPSASGLTSGQRLTESSTQRLSSNELDKRIVAGSVILYNSSTDVIENIRSYADQVDHLIVVDNSDAPIPEVIAALTQFKSLTYISNEGNPGVAYALNRAAEAALTLGYTYLLTMDDDTRVPPGMVDAMLTYVSQQGPDTIGIVGAQSLPDQVQYTAQDVWFTITSGNLLNLRAYAACGPFMESLFIDWVDHEYCFRLKANHYRVIELNYLPLIHRLGMFKEASVLGARVRKWISHSPQRMYYKARNSLYVMKMYEEFLPVSIRRFFYRAMVTDLINVVFFDSNKLQRLRFLLKAYQDYKRGRLGKLTA